MVPGEGCKRKEGMLSSAPAPTQRERGHKGGPITALVFLSRPVKNAYRQPRSGEALERQRQAGF